MSGGGATYVRLKCSCLECKTIISSNNLELHFGSEQCQDKKKSLVVPTNLKCPHCGKQCKNDNSYRQHYVRCGKNSDRIEPSYSPQFTFSGHEPWNKGLTKDENESLARAAAILKEKYKTGELKVAETSSFNPEFWKTPERRKQKSDWRKKLHEEHPETHPNRRLAGNRKKMTYPERVANDWFVTNNILAEHNVKIEKYYVDFLVGNVIVEIDGERWHPIGNEGDRIRDEVLSNLGYTVYRIRSKEKINERLAGIFNR
jgi:very-short-patch-repair endonuclease